MIDDLFALLGIGLSLHTAWAYWADMLQWLG